MTKTVLITGCSSGIGRATAQEFLDTEWEVYATARDTEDIEGLETAGAHTARLDVTRSAHVERVVERIVEEQGRIDCLVNNAGYGKLGPVEDVTPQEAQQQFDVNVFGPHRLIRSVLPHMREEGDGTIINVSSVLGRISMPGTGIYSGSKFALEAMSDALRVEVDEFGIDVVLVEPGPVKTKFNDRVEDELDELERTAAYEGFYELFDDTVLIGSDTFGAVTPERVAEDIVEAAFSPNPHTRYQVGKPAELGEYARFIPANWIDFLYRQARRFL
ncbi:MULTISPECIES: SDR family oxidoreductase [unclassified Haladaptatus]|uniref:SDR family oxidoreductase n=1 Tax=unclassified Haladaptatus TaxID=2622732 RepID=UPI0023E869CB|nr:MULTISPECIES: SDR family oxidoreductase [unclassified Haladaptatus]